MTGKFPIAFPPARQAFVDSLFALARAAGGQARLVGGVVRNWLMAGTHNLAFDPAQDLDLAVSLPITTFAAAARSAGLSVHETGLAHGTVTVTSGGQTAEVTQLRTDISTDGRHARIRATDSWDEDARRRDFTINAIYLDEDGRLYDPVGGTADLNDWRLRFVGDPARRLAEDHLRLLRALRFLATWPDLVMPEADRAAMAAHVHLLPALSAERIATELRRLMAGPGALPVLRLCADMGVDRAVFDTALRIDLLAHKGLAGVWPELEFALRLACCLPPGTRTGAARRLKLSRADIQLCDRADRRPDTAVLDGLLGDHWARSAYRLGAVAVVHALDQATATGRDLPSDRLRQIVFFRAPSCPVKGGDIGNRYGLKGPALGARLDALEQLWIDTGFELSTDQLLALYDSKGKGKR